MPALKRGDSMRAWGSRYARLVLDRCGGNKREASRVLGISYHTLNSYLRFPLCQPADATDAADLADAIDTLDQVDSIGSMDEGDAGDTVDEVDHGGEEARAEIEARAAEMAS